MILCISETTRAIEPKLAGTLESSQMTSCDQNTVAKFVVWSGDNLAVDCPR